MEGAVRRAVPIKAYLRIVLLCLLLSGCGNDGFVVIAINTGFVASNGACDGQFNMRNDAGLTLIVVIGSGTSIFLPSGVIGTCANIRPGAQVSVRGPTQNGRVTASQVQLR